MKFASHLLPTALLATTTLAAIQACQKGYCCDGPIIQTGSSDDFSPSAFSCCKGGNGQSITSGPNSPKKCPSGDQIPLTEADKESGDGSNGSVSVSIPAIATPTLGGSSGEDDDSSSTSTSSSTGDSTSTSSSNGEQTSASSSNGDSASISSSDGDSSSKSDSSEPNGAAASFDTGLANSLLGIVGAIAAAPVLIGAL